MIFATAVMSCSVSYVPNPLSSSSEARDESEDVDSFGSFRLSLLISVPANGFLAYRATILSILRNGPRTEASASLRRTDNPPSKIRSKKNWTTHDAQALLR